MMQESKNAVNKNFYHMVIFFFFTAQAIAYVCNALTKKAAIISHVSLMSSKLRLRQSIEGSFEESTKNVLKCGLVGFEGDDVLGRARLLDSNVALRENSFKSLQGIPVLAANVQTRSIISTLSDAGAILFTDMSAASEITSAASDVVQNPRDKDFSMTVKLGNLNAVKAISSVAAGQIPCSIIEGPVSDLHIAAALCGVTSYSVLRESGTSAAAVSVACSTVGIAAIKSVLRPPVDDLHSEESLRGVRVAVLGDRSVLELGSECECESSVISSIAVAASVLETLGATCEKLKLSRGTIVPESLAGFDLLLCPTTSTAATATAGAPRGLQLPPVLLPPVLQTECINFPCGLVADDDDGYGSVNELTDREGLPVGMMLVAVKKDTDRDNGSGSSAAGSLVLRAAAAYEGATRWSSEVFAPGQTRAQSREDMDDAR
jgi:hypothetical protein